MIQLTKQNADQYFAFLKALHHAIKTGNVSVSDLVKEHKVHYLSVPVLKANGIIASNGARAKAAVWNWGTIEPTEDMALELIRRLKDFKPIDKDKISPTISSVYKEPSTKRVAERTLP